MYAMAQVVDTWAFKGLLYHDFAACACTVMVRGPFGFLGPESVGWRFPRGIRYPFFFLLGEGGGSGSRKVHSLFEQEA